MVLLFIRQNGTLLKIVHHRKTLITQWNFLDKRNINESAQSFAITVLLNKMRPQFKTSPYDVFEEKDPGELYFNLISIDHDLHPA